MTTRISKSLSKLLSVGVAALAVSMLPCIAHAQELKPYAPHIPLHARPDHGPHTDRQPGTGQPEGPGPLTATENTIHRFGSFVNATDGDGPYSDLMLATDGKYYGTTYEGGASDYGEIFRFNPSTSAFSVLYSFCSQASCADGDEPYSGVVQDAEGNLWGTTTGGGTNNSGVIYKITLAGVYTVMYNFCGVSGCADGEEGYGALVQADDGNFYGMTYDGGANASGVIYRITPSGVYTKIYDFCSQASCADGAYAYGSLVQGTDGKLYGMTTDGGLDYGGTIFSIGTDGTGFSVVSNFCTVSACLKGYGPNYGHLTQYSDGSFYGMAEGGGAHSYGTIFKVTTGGTLTDLYDFCSATSCLDGASPYSSTLALGSDGNFYGVTEEDGANNGGTFFQITPSGTFTKLYDFCGLTSCTDGYEPRSGVVQAADGSFYGASYAGDGPNDGVIYRMVLSTAPASPITITVPSTITIGEPATLSFTAANAYSKTAQQCYAFATQQGGANGFYPLGQVPVTLSNGVLSGSISGPPNAPAGNYLFAVTCGGTLTATATATLAQPVATSVTVTSIPSLVSGQGIAFSAQVTAANLASVNVGTVSISCNGVVLGTNTVSFGSASVTINTKIAAAGSYACVAIFNDPTGAFASSTSAVDNVTVTDETTTISLDPPGGSFTRNQNITITAILNGPEFTPNYGTVTFSSAGWSTTVPVDYATGTAALTGVLTAPLGTYTLTATYSGATGAQGSSTTQTFTVVGCGVTGPRSGYTDSKGVFHPEC